MHWLLLPLLVLSAVRAQPLLAERLAPFDGPLGSLSLRDAEPCMGGFLFQFTPDGEGLVSLDEKHALIVCDLRTGEVRSRVFLQAPPGGTFGDPAHVRQLVLSPDANQVAMLWEPDSGQAQVAAWDIGSPDSAWKRAFIFESGSVTSPYHAITFSDDGTEVWLASVDGRTPLVRLDSHTGERRGELPGVGLGLLYGRPNWLFDLPDGTRFSHPLRIEPHPVAGQLVPPDGHTPAWPALVTTGSTLTWRADSEDDLSRGTFILAPRRGSPVTIPATIPPERAATILGHDHVSAMAIWSRDGRRLSLSLTDRVVILDVERGVVAGELRPRREGAVRVLAPPDGPFGLAWYPEADGADIEVFAVEGGDRLATLVDPVHPRILHLTFHPGDTHLLAATETSLHLFELRPGIPHVRIPLGLPDTPNAVHLLGTTDSDHALIAAMYEGFRVRLLLVDLTGGQKEPRPLSIRLDDQGELSEFRAGPVRASSGEVALLTRPDSKRESELLVFDPRAETVLWHRSVAAIGQPSLRFSDDGTVLHLSDQAWATSDGTPTEPVPYLRAEYVATPRRSWGAETVRSHDGSVLAEGTWLGSVWLYPASPPPPDLVANAIVRVREAQAVTPTVLMGRWTIEQALLKLHSPPNPPSTSDYSGFIGLGGFTFLADGTWLAGLLRMPGHWELLDGGRRLQTTDVKGRASVYEVRVDGDVMEWVSSEPPKRGEFQVDVYIRMKRVGE